MNAQPDDICQRPGCKSIRISVHYAPCFSSRDDGCICDGKRNHVLCHPFVEATK